MPLLGMSCLQEVGKTKGTKKRLDITFRRGLAACQWNLVPAQSTNSFGDQSKVSDVSKRPYAFV